MKIVQFMASEGWGGAEKVLVELSNQLARHCEVTVLLLRNTVYKNRFSPQVSIRELRANPTRYNPFLALEIYSVLKRERPDIVHTHAVKATELVAGVSKFLQFKHIGTKHNTRKGKIFNKLEFVTAVSSAVADSVKQDPQSHLSIIYNGIIPAPETPSQKKSETFTMLAIGRLDKVKGFDVLIKQVRKLTFDFHLKIIGAGPEKNNLEELIEQTGMTQKITLSGYQENIALIMKNSDLVIISSHSEGFSKVIIEGLFYAPVVIATPVGIATELFPAEILVDQDKLADKITEVYQAQNYFKEIFREIRQKKADLFLMDTIAADYLKLYDEIKGK